MKRGTGDVHLMHPEPMPHGGPRRTYCNVPIPQLRSDEGWVWHGDNHTEASTSTGGPLKVTCMGCMAHANARERSAPTLRNRLELELGGGARAELVLHVLEALQRGAGALERIATKLEARGQARRREYSSPTLRELEPSDPRAQALQQTPCECGHALGAHVRVRGDAAERRSCSACDCINFRKAPA